MSANVSLTSDGNEEKSMLEKIKEWYFIKKCLETVGLELTKVQSVYWRAVQRRMVLAQLEDVIEDNRGEIRKRKIKLPFELAASLIKNDQAIEKYLVPYLNEQHISIALPREVEQEDVDAGSPERLLGEDEPDTMPMSLTKQLTEEGVTSIDPQYLVKVMKRGELLMDNEEDFLEDKGGFLEQGWLALKFMKNKFGELMAPKVAKVEATEETDSPNAEMDEMDYFSSSDDDDDLLFDRIYDHEQSVSPDFATGRYQVYRAENENTSNDDGFFLSKVGGKSLRPAWTSIVEHIPLVVSNFRFKHIVKTRKVYDSEGWEVEEVTLRNKKLSKERHAKLRSLWKKAARWPLFTYWLMFIQMFIFIITVSVYGFAPVRYTPFTETALVQQADLSVIVLEKEITPNIWIGPPRDALVLLGANYGPCMRRDQLLYEAIDQDRLYEAQNSGCCVRRDGTGCVQVPTESDCPASGLADFVFYDPLVDTALYTNRSVCGTSPRTCLSPPSSSSSWRVESISDWPICTDTSSVAPSVNNSNKHLTCDITGRPCCIGIQAECFITTRENCDFLEGSFHEDAFLCSQVDCLKSICGLTPFATPDNPDQMQRLGLALFLHAGVLHLILTLLFDFIVMRNLEKYLGWLSTCILYLGSGIGGNVISGVFVPYSPEVGPAAAIFGVISFFVFIFYHWKELYSPLTELFKYTVLLLILMAVGFLPYIDNFARIGGLLFGLLFSFIHVHYIPPWEGQEEFERFKCEVEKVEMKESNSKKGLYVKIILIFIGVLFIVPLYVFSFSWFIEYQSTWDGFTYFNCIIPTELSDLCLDFSQNIRPRVYAG